MLEIILVIALLGWNSHGMLGNGTTQSKYNIVSKVRNTPHERNDAVRMVCCGPLISMYATHTHVYAAGDIGHLLNNPSQQNNTSLVFVPITGLPFDPSSITSIKHGAMSTCFLINGNFLWIYWNFGKKQTLTMPQHIGQFYPATATIVYSLLNGKILTFREINFEFDRNELAYHETELGTCDHRCFNSFVHTSRNVILFHVGTICAKEAFTLLYNMAKLEKFTDVVVNSRD